MLRTETRNGGSRTLACGVLALFIFSAAAVLPLSAGAQSNAGDSGGAVEQGLSPAEKKAVEDAVQRGDAVTVHAIVTAAIARDSSRTAGIIADAVRAAPGLADSIVESASSTFPGLQQRIRKAAQAAREEAHEAAERTVSDHPASRRPHKPAILYRDPEVPGNRKGSWPGETAVGGTYREAESSDATASVSARIVRQDNPWKYSGQLDFDYGSTNDETKTQRLNLKGRTSRDLTDRLFALGILEYENDRFSGFDYQISEGIGLGYRVFDHPSFTLDIEGGPALRQSKVEATGELDQELLLRLGFNVDWQISNTAGFTNQTTVFVSKDSIDFENATRALIPDSSETKNVSALDFDIIGNLSARLSYEFSYRSDPPAGGAPPSPWARCP